MGEKEGGEGEGRGMPSIHLAKGRPYAHRETIPSFEPVELQAYAKNVEWLHTRDRYASLLVSMHRTGLWANRYDVFSSPRGRVRERSAEVTAAKRALEAHEGHGKNSLGAGKVA